VINPHPNCRLAFIALMKARGAFAAFLTRLRGLAREYREAHNRGAPDAPRRWERLAAEEARHRDAVAAIGQALGRAQATERCDRRAGDESRAMWHALYADRLETLRVQIDDLGVQLAEDLAEVERLRGSRRG
jgi:hypothetical protein